MLAASRASSHWAWVHCQLRVLPSSSVASGNALMMGSCKVFHGSGAGVNSKAESNVRSSRDVGYWS